MPRLLATTILAASLLLAGCAPPAPASPTAAAPPTGPARSAGPTPGTSPSPAAVQPAGPRPAVREKVLVAVGSAPAVPYLHLDLARALGYYEDENLEVELSYFRAGTEAATALLSGQAPYSGNAVDHAVKARPQGKEIVALATFTTLPGITLLVRQELRDRVRSLGDLKGTKVGVSSLGSGTHQLLLNLMAREGLQPTDLEIVAAGTSTVPAALESGAVAAAMSSDPFTAQLLQTGKAFSLIDLARQEDVAKYLGGDFVFTSLLTTPAVIRERPEATQRLVNAVYRACRFIGANPPEAIAARLPKEIVGESLETYVLGLRHQYAALSKDCTPTSAGVQNFIQSQIVAGVVKESEAPKPEALIDLSFVKRAAAR